MPPLHLLLACPAMLIALVLVASPSCLGAAASPPSLIDAVRAGDRGRARDLLGQGGAAEERDIRGNTALHWAALAKDERAVSWLLAAGADPRATNHAGATPLHYGTGSDRIVRRLLRAGADPSARSAAGSTPLHTAAARPGGFGSVRLLVEAGADVNAIRSLFPGGVNVPSSDPGLFIISPLALAIYYGDPRAARFLLERGAEPGGGRGFTPLVAAAFSGRGELMDELVRRGGKVNVEDGFVGHVLNNLLYAGHRRLVPLVLESGADLHTTTMIGEKTPPMVFAAYTEAGDLEVARALLARGADVNTTSSAGHTALDWAMRRGETPLVAFLRSAGGTNGQMPSRAKAVPDRAIPADPAARAAVLRDSVQRALEVLQPTSDRFLETGFVRESGCVSCHHQTLPAVAFGRARERGLHLREDSLARQLTAQQSAWTKGLEPAYEMFEPQPDSPANLGYGLFGLHSLGYEPDDLTAAMVWFIAASQLPDGSFPGFDRRPPMEEGQVIATAFAAGALRRYPQPVASVDVEAVLGRARAWLRKARTEDPNQEVHRLLGLAWAGAPARELRSLGRALAATQREDGGWAPLPTLPSDSWATGLTLFALHEAGVLASNDSRYRRGVDYLLRTQFPDGSWWVRSRTWPLQPHFDSGFPHGKDQWISAGATAWAVIAMLNEVEATADDRSLPSARVLMARHGGSPRAVGASGDASGADPSSEGREAAFVRDILPVLQRSCVDCHGGAKPKGGLSVETVGGLLKGGQSGEASVVFGRPEASPLLRYVADELEDLEMPPLSRRHQYPAFTVAERDRLRAWVAGR